MAEQANYQGEHLGLSLNRDAAYALGDALERLRSSYRDDASAQVPLRLPDGRTLQLRVSLNDRGALHDSYGDYLDDDGVAHADVTGDLAAHFEARKVLDAAARSNVSFEVSNDQLDGAEVDLDDVAARRVAAAIEDLPHRYGRTDEWVEQLRARALDRAREVLPDALDSSRQGRQRTIAARSQPTAPAAAAGPDQRDAQRALPTRAGDGLSLTPALAVPAPPTRLRNPMDDHRRSSSDHVRGLRRLAADATAAGQLGDAADWTGQAREWEKSAAFWRDMAATQDRHARAADPQGYAERLATARTRDSGRTAGSDGRSGGVGMAM